MKLLYYFGWLLLCLAGCTGKEREGQASSGNYPQTLVFSKNISFAIDESTVFSPYTLQYLDTGDSTYLLMSNRNTMSIDVYDASKGQRTARMYLNDEQRQYISELTGFWAISKDSVLVYQRYQLYALLLKMENWQVKERQEFHAEDPRSGSRVFNHASMTARPSFFKEGKIHMAELPLKNIKKLIGTGYEMELEWELGTSKVNLPATTTWPDAYRGIEWDEFEFFSWAHNTEGSIVYAWQADHNIIVKYPEGSIKTFPARSDAFTKPIDYDPTLIKGGKDVNWLEQNHYANIIYDKYRKVYYRFAIHSVPYKNANGDWNTAFDAPFSIITLDERFNKIAEDLFPGGRYLWKDAFVSREGLCLSDHNLRNYDNLGEDIISFSVFKLQPNIR